MTAFSRDGGGEDGTGETGSELNRWESAEIHERGDDAGDGEGVARGTPDDVEAGEVGLPFAELAVMARDSEVEAADDPADVGKMVGIVG